MIWASKAEGVATASAWLPQRIATYFQDQIAAPSISKTNFSAPSISKNIAACPNTWKTKDAIFCLKLDLPGCSGAFLLTIAFGSFCLQVEHFYLQFHFFCLQLELFYLQGEGVSKKHLKEL